MKNYQNNARIKNIQLVFMFDHFKMGELRQMCIWLNLNLNLNLEFEFAIQLQYTSIKMKLPQISSLHIIDNLNMCLCIYIRCCPPLVDDCSGNRLAETVIISKKNKTGKLV